MYNARRKKRPFTYPKNMADAHVILDKMTIDTCRGEPFLLVNDHDSNIVIFSCPTNLNILSDMETIFVDGTFEFCTKFFKQFFTVHGIRNGHYMQLAYALLPSKNTAVYEKFFELLLQTCPLMPASVVIDFEAAIHKAARKAWPGVLIIGCRFHIRQSWYRKIQVLGLQTQYNDEKSSVGKWLRYCFGLPFLDPSEVEDGFSDLISIRPQGENLEKFSDYLLNNYISNSATFPPTIWAAMTSSLERTTNACESFHSRFNKSFYHAHPDLFTFVERLKEFQTDTYVEIQSMHIQNTVRSTYASKRIYIDGLIQQYESDEITRLQFIKRTGYYLCPDVAKKGTTSQPNVTGGN